MSSAELPVASDGKSAGSKSPGTKKWPNRREDYELKEVIGSGATAVVQVAKCLVNGEKVAIKRIDLDTCGASIEELQKEITLMSHCNHPNVINYYTSFVVKHELWLIMKLMAGGSLLDIIKHVSSKGEKGGILDEIVIATILKEVLQGLEYFHSNGQIHRDMKAGNILVGEDGVVQIADFGVSSWLHNEFQPRLGGKAAQKVMPRNTFVGTPCWMAPEVMDQSVGYNQKADIWSFGITALELATGTAPYAKFPPMKVLMLTLENPPPTLETCGDLNGVDYKKHYSKMFQKMVEKCLHRDPDKRLSASELLKLPLFKKAKTKEFIKEVVIGGALSLQSRAKKVKRVPGSSGRLHKTEGGEWEWSDEECAEEEPRQPSQAMDTSSQAAKASSQNTQSPPKDSSLNELEPQHRELLQKLTKLEQQLQSAKEQHEKLLKNHQTSQQTTEQLAELKKAFELVQSLEREKQQLDFQAEQHKLNMKQSKAANDMNMEIQKAMQKHGLEPAPVETTNKSSRPIKLALRKRTENNQLKDIKFDFIPGNDQADAIANDLVQHNLVDGRNLVVVAANIEKIVGSPGLDKVVFKLASSASEQIDEKKLIGCAQISRIKE